MKPNLLDRAIGAVAPVYAAKRAKARLQMAAVAGMPNIDAIGASSYSSTDGSDPFMRRWSVAPRDAAYDTLRGLPDQRAQSRDLVRNNPLASSAIGTNVQRAIGTGLALSAKPHLATLGWSKEQAEAWIANVQAEFSLWADSRECDHTGDQNFYELQELVLRAMLESGDCFTLLPDGKRTATQPYALRLQVLEADRIGNPEGKQDSKDFAGGVRWLPEGPVGAYHVYAQHPGSVLHMADMAKRYAGEWVEPIGQRSGRRRILHHFLKTRPGMPRGLPYLAPVMGLFKLLGTYTDAEVKAAVVSAFLTVFIETPTGAGIAPVFGLSQTQQTQAQGPAGDEIGLGPAAVVGLAAGEKATVVNPGRPNPAFGPFVEAVLDQLGAGTMLGSEMLLKKFSTSYTAARAAFLDTWKWLLNERTLIARSFCQPAYETWMAEAVAIGRISAPGFFSDARMRWAYTRAHWHGDSQGSLNPKDEIAAYREAVDARLVSHERAEWELFGTDWQETYSTKKAEHDRMAADGMLPTPKAGAAAPAAKPDPAQAQALADAAAAREQAFLAMAASVAAMADRETPAPVTNVYNTVAPAAVTAPITVQPAAQHHHTHIDAGAVAVQLDAHMPAVSVPVTAQFDVHTPPAAVTVQPAPPAPAPMPTRQVFEYDQAGEIAAITTTPVHSPKDVA